MDEYTVSFEIREDTGSTDRQWFYFRAQGVKGVPIRYRLRNINETNIPIHWKDSRPVFSSEDTNHWRRIPGRCSVTEGAEAAFEFVHAASSDDEHIAFHYPYSYTDVQNKIDQWRQHPHVLHHVIGKSIEGRNIDLLRVMEPATGVPLKERIAVWITCRQHAAETNASWFLDGFMDWMLSDKAAEFRRKAIVNVVPMINPDGVVAGNYRDNIKGVNLNRVWNAADAETSPEILAVTTEVARWVADGNRYDLYIDLHGDSEALSCYAFHADETIRPEKYKGTGTYHEDTRRYLAMVAKRCPDFTLNEGMIGTDDIGLSRQFMTFTYHVLAILFENGYSYVNYGPHAGEWLTPERHAGIGFAAAQAMADYLNPQ